MPSDRTPSQAEIDAAAKALFPFLHRYRWDELPKDCPAHMDARHKAKDALSAAATARPDEDPESELSLSLAREQRLREALTLADDAIRAMGIAFAEARAEFDRHSFRAIRRNHQALSEDPGPSSHITTDASCKPKKPSRVQG